MQSRIPLVPPSMSHVPFRSRVFNSLTPPFTPYFLFFSILVLSVPRHSFVALLFTHVTHDCTTTDTLSVMPYARLPVVDRVIYMRHENPHTSSHSQLVSVGGAGNACLSSHSVLLCRCRRREEKKEVSRT